MIITCPHCHTRYQVASDMIGSAGRKVQCAHCHRDWQARPAPPEPPETADDKLFSALEEEKLDDAFADAEQAGAPDRPSHARPAAESVPAAPAPVGPSEDRKATAAAPAGGAQSGKAKGALKATLTRFARRERLLLRQMPQARLRRAVRLGGAVALVGLLAGLYVWRTDLVRSFPSLDGLYEAVGLPINVVGLEFSDVKTLKALSGGVEKLVIDANIVSVAGRPVSVPPVIVTLADAGGQPIYEWSAVGPAGEVDPGRSVPFETQLPAPPAAASKVVLTFGPGSNQGPRAPKAAASEQGDH